MDELATRDADSRTAMSLVMSIDAPQVKKEINAISNFQSVVNQTLVKDKDYGVIPGTNRPTLLKPGAEKILMILGLQSQYSIKDKVENWDEGFFSYTVQATLLHDGQLVTEGLGSANTRETRYQLKSYDKAQHKKVWDGSTYQDPYTLQNTVLKMAKKRAQVDAALTVGSLSDVFTQDVEDLQQFGREEHAAAARTTKPDEIQITFGKYKGQTLAQVGATDEGLDYIKWLSNSARQPDMKAAAKRFYDAHTANHASAPTNKAPESPSRHAEKPKAPAKPTQSGTPDADPNLDSLAGFEPPF